MAFFAQICCGNSPFCRKESIGKEGRPRWRVFSLKELQLATNGFNHDNKVGEGGSGSVYWGQLWDGSQVRLKIGSNKAEMEFALNVEILGRVRHKNLLSLRGYCAKGQERLIVYDYMPNFRLHSHLHGQHSAEYLLDWERRMNIAIGLAEAIAYHHNRATPHIIHGNIKTNHVLLDSEFEPKVADFGFAKLIPERETHVTRVKGSLGYVSPEYAMFGKASKSCDVYSFGILLLELASGRKAIEMLSATMQRTITNWALPLTRERKQFDEIADPKLSGKHVKEELKRVVLVALVCTQIRPEKRPTLLEVLDLLKGDSNEKLSELENDEMFNQATSLLGAEEKSKFILEEDSKQDLKKLSASGKKDEMHGKLAS